MKLSLLLMLVAGLGTLQAGNLEVDLSSPPLTGAPGDLLQFFGTMTNVSPTDTIFLNSISSTSISSFLTIDIGPFFVNAPLFLNPGDVSGPFEIFDVTIDPATPDGPYLGSFVSIQGGADSETFDDLADVNFDLQVNSITTAAPEPSTGLLLLVGAAAAFAILTRNHNARFRA
ncbi:MAG TPA: PEP-CTERM sorting domain-containing protein [Bryobacteraceae bacterium]|nr:PEP-CTERM sorting domain-containing protein [Bryobacteraceae bacterium]